MEEKNPNNERRKLGVNPDGKAESFIKKLFTKKRERPKERYFAALSKGLV